MSEQQLIFGSGGGVTGAVNSCYLMDNGQLFYHKSLEDSWSELDKTKGKQAEALFNQYTELGLSDMELNRPGNYYYFIEMKNNTENESSSHRLTWGDSDYQPPARLVEYYQRLEKLLEQ